MNQTTGRPGLHPDPDPAFAVRVLPGLSLEGLWYRTHQTQYSPLFWGRTGLNRFDSPEGAFGVLYVALEPSGAFAETFISIPGQALVSRVDLDARSLATLASVQPLTVVDLTGPGLARLGADDRLTSGEHAVAQRWSKAIHDHSLQPHGILYRARHDPAQLSLAIFERAKDLIQVNDTVPYSAMALRRLAALLERYQFALI